MPETEALGRLTSMPARHVWRHEAHNFTPWLVENADVLGEVLGMDLAIHGAEHRVGGYALDVIGVDEATGERIIIENQLEGSDHSHLGQILTYAGGTDPTNIVWIASQFREEHRAALEWLNERTDEATRFFAIEVSAVRIGNSPPAPLLSLVVRPNDWGKRVRATTSVASGPSARLAAYREFWDRFLRKIHAEHPRWTNARSAPAQNWMNLPTGMSNVLYGVNFGKKGLCSELYLGAPDSETNAARYAAALTHRRALEDTYGAQLTWDPLPGKKAARMAEYAPGQIEHSEQWEAYLDWFVAHQSRLRDAIQALGGFQVLFSSTNLHD